METLEENKEQLFIARTANLVMKKLQMSFEKRSEIDPVMKIDDIKQAITKMSCGQVISTLDGNARLHGGSWSFFAFRRKRTTESRHDLKSSRITKGILLILFTFLTNCVPKKSFCESE